MALFEKKSKEGYLILPNRVNALTNELLALLATHSFDFGAEYA